MRIAVATDQDFVASHFGCCPACTIVDIEGGQIRETLIIPNPGCHHAFWGDLFCRNSIKTLITGNMGTQAKSVLRGFGIDLILGVEGPFKEAVRRFIDGELRSEPTPEVAPGTAGPCNRTS